MTVSRELREATATVVESLTKAELIACVENDAFVTARVVALMAERALAVERESARAAMQSAVEGDVEGEYPDPSARVGVLMMCRCGARLNLDMTECEWATFAGSIKACTVHACPVCGGEMEVADVGCYSGPVCPPANTVEVDVSLSVVSFLCHTAGCAASEATELGVTSDACLTESECKELEAEYLAGRQVTYHSQCKVCGHQMEIESIW